MFAGLAAECDWFAVICVFKSYTRQQQLILQYVNSGGTVGLVWFVRWSLIWFGLLAAVLFCLAGCVWCKTLVRFGRLSLVW